LTYPGLLRIQTLRHDAEQPGRKVLRQLAPYYEDEAKAVEGASIPSDAVRGRPRLPPRMHKARDHGASGRYFRDFPGDERHE